MYIKLRINHKALKKENRILQYFKCKEFIICTKNHIIISMYENILLITIKDKITL